VSVAATAEDARELEAARRAESRWRDFLSRLDDAAVHDSHPTVHHLTKVRDGLLREEGLPDVYGAIKRSENERSMALYRTRPGDVSGDPESDVEDAVWGVFAGNVFDLASPSVAEDYRAGRLHFPDLVRRARARSLAVDDRKSFRDELRSLRCEREPHVVMLVDNAGMDFVLGCVPLGTALIEAGCRVTLAANERPSLNDMTADEARQVLRDLVVHDHRIGNYMANDKLTVISTGNGSPGIDLRTVSDLLNRACESADLLILEGQGRAIETTWTAVLSIPTLRVATLKSPIVSGRLGLEPYDLIFDFRSSGEQPPRRLSET
jgi:uncharacterized protein with ATP-grasp and redox domains